MNLDINQPIIRTWMFEGRFGLEKESLRLNRSSRKLSRRPHPFSHPRIDRDFAESQTEINTEICEDLFTALRQTEELTKSMLKILDEMDEVLWPFSNPPRIESEDEIEMFHTEDRQIRAYREYLARKYGKRKMLFCGIHFNFSFPEKLIKAQYMLCNQKTGYSDFKNAFYLDLAQKLVRYSWVINCLCNASPVYDGSLRKEEFSRHSCFCARSSMRNSSLGYWNFFEPCFDYSSLEGYIQSIQDMVDSGKIIAPRELYYPVRLKPAASYSLEAMRDGGIDHIELRMIDLNPYELCGLSIEHAQWIHLLLVYLACISLPPLSLKDQKNAEANDKNASLFDLENALIAVGDKKIPALEAVREFLDSMASFYLSIKENEAASLVMKMKEQILSKTDRLSCRVLRSFSDYFDQGMEQALRFQQVLLESDSSCGSFVPTHLTDNFSDVSAEQIAAD